MTTEPALDLRLSLQRSNGPLPPPHAYRMRLELGPGGEVQLCLQPSYLDPEAPRWRAAFQASPIQVRALADRLLRGGLLERPWPASLDTPVGGGTCALEGTLDGQHFALPPGLGREDEAAASLLFQAVEELLPPGLMNRLLKQRERWIAAQG